MRDEINAWMTVVLSSMLSGAVDSTLNGTQSSI